MSQPKASQFCYGSCRAVLVRYCAQTFIYCLFGRDSRSELALVFQPGRWTGVFMPLSILHLRRHIVGCSSDLSSRYIFVTVPSMIFTYICSGIVLFYFIYFGIWDLFSFFQLLSPQANWMSPPACSLQQFPSPVSPLLLLVCLQCILVYSMCMKEQNHSPCRMCEWSRVPKILAWERCHLCLCKAWGPAFIGCHQWEVLWEARSLCAHKAWLARVGR